MPGFIGRQAELQRLVEATQKRSASFIIVRGRRRIGKSRLIEEFAKGFGSSYVFAGLPPEKNTTAKHQLDEFSRQIARQFHTASAQYQDWSDALWAIGERVQSGKVLLFFDEISWMGSKDPNFLGKIKNAWDQQFKKNDRLVFVVCGSASSWIEENLLSGTGFVGRISYTLTLEELPLPDCNRFWPESISAYEKFKILSVTGGVPKYLEEIDPKRSAEENIKRLCFTRGGFLVEEFEQVFNDIFLRDSEFYRQILELVCAGAKEMPAIKSLLTGDQHGRVSEYLRELELAGFIARDYSWNLKSGTDARLSRFRLKDNYLRFYLKYVKKNLGKISRDGYALKSLTSLPEWPTIMGLQFENLVLNNRQQLHRLLELNPAEIVNDNPFYQHKTARQPGCQIDYLIQTKFDTLYVCEIKFSRNEVGSAVIEELRAKIEALTRPRGMSCRPVLIHVNGVTAEVIDSDYFAHIVDMSRLLT
jgi:AAA+ ATPase superfamily predicted ATPase